MKTIGSMLHDQRQQSASGNKVSLTLMGSVNQAHDRRAKLLGLETTVTITVATATTLFPSRMSKWEPALLA